MEVLSGRQTGAVRPEGPGLDGNELPPSLVVGILGTHALADHLSYETGDARLLLRGFDPNPSGGILFEGDRDVLHDTKLVGHGFSVKDAFSSWPVSFSAPGVAPAAWKSAEPVRLKR
jgi:hypothetical protein